MPGDTPSIPGHPCLRVRRNKNAEQSAQDIMSYKVPAAVHGTWRHTCLVIKPLSASIKFNANKHRMKNGMSDKASVSLFGFSQAPLGDWGTCHTPHRPCSAALRASAKSAQSATSGGSIGAWSMSCLTVAQLPAAVSYANIRHSTMVTVIHAAEFRMLKKP